VAQDLILQAREVRRQSDAPDAVRKFLTLAEAAIRRDPNYADAYLAKADGHFVLGTNYPSDSKDMARQLASAEVAVRRAMAIAPKLGSAHMALSTLNAGRLEYQSALQNTRQALALSAEDPAVVSPALFNVTYLGDGSQALRLSDQLIRLDPLNGRSFIRRSEAMLALRRFRQAIEAGRKGIELAPKLNQAHIPIGYSFILLGQSTEADAEFRSMPADDPYMLTGKAILAARAGDRAGMDRIIDRVRQVLGDTGSYQYAQVRAQAGQTDAAFADLQAALRARDPGLIYTKTDPFLDPIRSDPRYAAVIRRLNFP
jgi:tetratricopeptide (TPR) repeat protein